MTSAAELFNTLKYRIVVNPATGTRRYYNHANQLHREDGPAIEYSDGAKCWYRNGKLHREDGPAVIYHNGTRKWLLNGIPHRTDGPAVESGSYCEWHIWGTRYTEEKYRQRLKTLGTDAQQNCVQSIEMQH
jgi:hypothetical protein